MGKVYRVYSIFVASRKHELTELLLIKSVLQSPLIKFAVNLLVCKYNSYFDEAIKLISLEPENKS